MYAYCYWFLLIVFIGEKRFSLVFLFFFHNSIQPREGFVLFVIVFIEGSKKEAGSASAGEEQTKSRGCGSAGVLRGGVRWLGVVPLCSGGVVWW